MTDIIQDSSSSSIAPPVKIASKKGSKSVSKKPVLKAAVSAAGAKKSKAPANHPQYVDMATQAIQALKEHKGSSRQAVLKYIMANFNVGNDAKIVNARLKAALKRGLITGAYKQSKGTGAAGSFKLGDKKTEAQKSKTAKPKSTTVATPSKKASPAKKPKSPKKAAEPSKKKVVSQATAVAPAGAAPSIKAKVAAVKSKKAPVVKSAPKSPKKSLKTAAAAPKKAKSVKKAKSGTKKAAASKKTVAPVVQS